ncbi:hypothetical protein ACFWPK_17965 [Nocardia sp. NPDC058519]|uniref:hypothetical protein n=1 Tax=Nocardia sp. NPDC058519 TaxID=3346535 RepID=UPI00365C07B2
MYDTSSAERVRPGPARSWRIATGVGVPLLGAWAAVGLLWNSLTSGYLFATITSDGDGFPSLDMALLALLLAMAAALGWAVLAIIGIVRYRNPWPHIAVAPLIAIVLAALLLSGVPGWLGWRLSENALRDAAAQCTAQHTRIGVFYVEETHPTAGNGCVFQLSDRLYYGANFSYLPRGPQAGARIDGAIQVHFEHWRGPWYHTHVST